MQRLPQPRLIPAAERHCAQVLDRVDGVAVQGPHRVGEAGGGKVVVRERLGPGVEIAQQAGGGAGVAFLTADLVQCLQRIDVAQAVRDAGAVVRGGPAAERRRRATVASQRQVDCPPRSGEAGRIARQLMVCQQYQQRARLRPEFAVLDVAGPIAHGGGVDAEIAVGVLRRAQRANQRVGALPVPG